MVAPAFDEVALDGRRLGNLAVHDQHRAGSAQGLTPAKRPPCRLSVLGRLQHGRPVALFESPIAANNFDLHARTPPSPHYDAVRRGLSSVSIARPLLRNT